jgi:hypothetical protein
MYQVSEYECSMKIHLHHEHPFSNMVGNSTMLDSLRALYESDYSSSCMYDIKIGFRIRHSFHHLYTADCSSTSITPDLCFPFRSAPAPTRKLTIRCSTSSPTLPLSYTRRLARQRSIRLLHDTNRCIPTDSNPVCVNSTS